MPVSLEALRPESSVLCLALRMQYHLTNRKDRHLKFLSNSFIIQMLSEVEMNLYQLQFVFFSYKLCPFQLVDSLLSVIQYAYLHTPRLQTIVDSMSKQKLPSSYRLPFIHTLLENIESLAQNRPASPTVQTSSTVLSFAKALQHLDTYMMVDILHDPKLTVRLLQCLQQLYDNRNQLCIESNLLKLSNAIASVSTKILKTG